ncbi:MAG: hypothetical protein ABI867_30600 [Kofleriaceae bacterium]
MMRHVALLLLALGCSHGSRVGEARFANAPPVTVVDDRRNVPEAPEPRKTALLLYMFDGNFYRRITRAMEVPAPRRALGVNSMDDVPDSTWFTNRIGVRNMAPAEIKKGPADLGSPEQFKPWTIKNTKVGGQSTGLVMKDSRGNEFVLKFDKKGYPEAETATDAIVGRLLWAFGYNVPEDNVVYCTREDLILTEKSVIKLPFGKPKKLTKEVLDELLTKVEIEKDGRMRAIASRVLKGTWLGGHRNEGTRDDDLNDRIPHELRRDLRGTYAVYGWLAHGDVKEHNWLDMWVADPERPKHHYVKHYLIDFGKALGVMAVGHRDMRDDHVYRIDWSEMGANLFTFGLRKRSWEDRSAPKLRGLGLYDIDSYKIVDWRPNTPAYTPFHTSDRFDNYWASKILIRFTREQLAAAVDAGRLTEPRAKEYLLKALIERQRMTARHYFERVAPLEKFAMSEGALCFDDLALEYKLGSIVGTRYTISVYDVEGRELAAPRTITPEQSHTCLGAVPMPRGGDQYTIVRIDTTRANLDAATLIHLARDPKTGNARVVGIRRL